MAFPASPGVAVGSVCHPWWQLPFGSEGGVKTEGLDQYENVDLWGVQHVAT